MFLIVFLFYFFFNYIYNNIFRKYYNTPKIESLFKDKEFILFKFNLFNIYYTSIIILFIFLFKNNLILSINNLNLSAFILFFIIFIIYFILFNNVFIIILFKLYLEIKFLFYKLNEIKLEHIVNITNKNNNNNNNQLFYQSRNFSTFSNLKQNKIDIDFDLEKK